MRSRAALGCVLLAACGSPIEGDDAGPRIDAGSFSSDAGTTLDAGRSDAGPEQDAGGPPDAGVDAGRVTDAGFSVLRYPSGRTQSPLTPEVVAHLQSIARLDASKNAALFSKLGDSNTVNTNYFGCFAGAQVDLAGRTQLQRALTHFLSGTVGGTTPFDRTSLCATIGWSAFSALAGAPTPLQQEVDAVLPRFATVMFGTNDVGFADPHMFGRNMFTIVDTLSMQGVVPLISAIPPRDDDATIDAWVPKYNLVARGIAQARKLPFVDLHRELLAVPSHGLGPDGVHLNVFVSGSVKGCAFTPAGLAFGHNTRNLVTLEGLSRAWNAVSSGTAPDATAPRISGTGLPGDEVVIDSLPFVDVRDTRADGVARINSYPGCASTANESGREVLYRLELSQATNVRVFVVSLGTSDIDVHLLSNSTSGQSCLVRNDKTFVRQLAAGTYWLSLDTYQSAAGVLPGEYLVGVIAE